MFRLHRHKSSAGIDYHKSRQSFHFTFSCFQALQVPKGWDKLFLSLLSTETGKTVSKSGKASVKNGNCHWADTFSESMWISLDNHSKEPKQCLFKFLIAVGSSRSSILGETTMDMSAFVSSEVPILVSLPLKGCKHGTILQVEVRCLTPRPNSRFLINQETLLILVLRDLDFSVSLTEKGQTWIFRMEKWKETSIPREDDKADYHELDTKSDISDCTYTKSVESLSTFQLDSPPQPRELGSRGTSFSTTISHYSFDYSQTERFSSQSHPAGDVIGRHGSTESDCSSPNSMIMGKNGQYHEENRLSSAQRAGFSSRKSIEPDEVIAEELKAEAIMWERNARKLKADLKNIKEELTDQSQNITDLTVQLAASRAECLNLTEEIQKLKVQLEESRMKEIDTENINVARERESIEKQLQDEMRFLKELNEDLALQLQKTQESNVELVSLLQDLEEIIAKQEKEIHELSELKSKVENSSEDICTQEDNEVNPIEQVFADESGQQILYSDSLPSTSNIDEENLHGNRLLQKNAMEDENIKLEIEKDIKRLILKKQDEEWSRRLAAKEEEIYRLEKALAESLSSQHTKYENSGERKEAECPKQKLQELARGCSELKQENLEPDVSGNGVYHFSSEGTKLDGITESETQELVTEMKKNTTLIERLASNNLEIQENCQNHFLEHFSELEAENILLLERISGLEAQLRYLTDTSESRRLELMNLVYQVTNLQNEIIKLQAEMDAQKLGMMQKFFEMETRLSEECGRLKEVNIKLQATTESLIEECNSLQNLNEDLKVQKLDLQRQCVMLEVELRKLQDSLCSCSKNLGTLEGEFSSVMEKLTTKQKTLNVKYDVLRASNQENEKCHLHGQLYMEEDEDTENIEPTLLDLDNVEMSEREINIVGMKPKSKILHLFQELFVSEKDQEDSVSDQAKLLKLIKHVISYGAKLEAIVYELELQTKFSELERCQLEEENSLLHLQLEKVAELQNELLDLKVSLTETKSKNQILEGSLNSISGEYEGLSTENTLLEKKISTMKKELEACKHSKTMLEEKMLRLQGDLIAREASCTQEAEMRNELYQIKRTNSHFLLQIKNLEHQREDLSRKVESLEEQLNHARSTIDNHIGYLRTYATDIPRNQLMLSEAPEGQDSCSERCQGHNTDHASTTQTLEDEIPPASEANFLQLKNLFSSREAAPVSSQKSETEKLSDSQNSQEKISMLEAELQDIRGRYLQISLKYAEVEAQREQLVMKLKTFNNRKSTKILNNTSASQ